LPEVMRYCVDTLNRLPNPISGIVVGIVCTADFETVKE
jgi:hypothetical protein